MEEADTTETVEAGEETTAEPTYTDEELAEYKTLFAKFDRDGSDSIDLSELGDALRYLGCNPMESEVEVMIAEADGKTNNNGMLEFSEFCEIIAKNRKTLELEEEELKKAFRLFDKDDSGTITRDELKQTVKGDGLWEAMTDEELDQMFDTVDTDGNGKIDYNELVQVILANAR